MSLAVLAVLSAVGSAAQSQVPGTAFNVVGDFRAVAPAGSRVVGVAAVPARIWNVKTSVVNLMPIELDEGEVLSAHTADLSSGADPVLHLLDAGGRQVAMDDNGGGGAEARLTYQSAERGRYTLLIRARSAKAEGNTTLVITHGRSRSSRPVQLRAWREVALANLRAGEVITSVRTPTGTAANHTLFLLHADGVGIERRRADNGIGNAAELVLPVAAGSRSVVLASTDGVVEDARLVRNDAALLGHDTDGDGIGRELESAAQTCARRSDRVAGVDCAAVADLRDTDGDGIADGAELLGVKRSGTLGLEDLPLPRWGADPRHKDMFVEVDFMRRTKQENDDAVRLHMAASVARQFALFFGDGLTTNPADRALHATMVGNPDGVPGIAVHLDVGRAPETAADIKIFGNWGGYTAVDAVQVDGSYRGVSAASAWKTHMSASRRGIFRYALAYGTGGGQTGPGFTASYNFNSGFVAPHETGHSLGLGHAGPYGLSPDVNCKPNYPSLMNYAFDSGAFGFADGRAVNGPPLNNSALRESNVAVGAAPSYFDVLERVFGYRVDRAGGHVDWNRDGEFAAPGTTVRAYANLALGGGGCEFTRHNRTAVGDEVTRQPPALARRDDTLYAFHVHDQQIRYSVSRSSWDCPVPAPEGCAGGSWAGTTYLGLPTAAGSVDAVTIGTPGREEILVVAVDLDQGLWERRIGASSSTDWARLPGRATLGGPSLVRRADGSVTLAFTDPTGVYRVRQRTAGGTWNAERPILGPDGVALRRPAGSRFSPALVEATLAHRPGVSGLYALLAAADDRLDLWGYNPDSSRWENTGMLDTRPGPINWRPAMAWVPPGPTSMVGRLNVVYSSRGDTVAKMMMSYVRVTGSPNAPIKTQRVGIQTYFDNVWRTASGIDLLYEPDADTNLRALLAYGENGRIWFHPKADGINDTTYRNQNDWTVLRTNLCSGVVNPGGLITNPIQCRT